MSTLEIYGTLGPSCADPGILRQMFETGITGMRLNLSHGTLEHSAGMIEAFHKASAEAGVRPSLLIDMQGPELRIGNIEKGRILEEGETVELADRSRGFVPKGAVPVPPEIFSHYEDGMILLIDDGKRKLKTTGLVHSAEGDTITARVLTGGELLSRKSIAAEGMAITGNTLTEQDLMNLRDAARFGVTDVMQPFVRGAKDLREVREAMQESGAGSCRLFAKIENTAGIAAVEGGCSLHGRHADAGQHGKGACSHKSGGFGYLQRSSGRRFRGHDHGRIRFRHVSPAGCGLSGADGARGTSLERRPFLKVFTI